VRAEYAVSLAISESIPLKILRTLTFMLSITSLAAKIFGASKERKVKTYRARVEEINALEPELVKLSDEIEEDIIKKIQ